jgi:hypothetical protein
LLAYAIIPADPAGKVATVYVGRNPAETGIQVVPLYPIGIDAERVKTLQPVDGARNSHIPDGFAGSFVVQVAIDPTCPAHAPEAPDATT